MKTIIKIILVISIYSSPFFSQKESIDINKWGITGGIGINTTSTNSKNTSLLNYNLSLGGIRTLKVKGKVTHSLHLKYSVFKESIKGLNYYYLTDNNILMSEKYNQKNSYSMVYLGYNTKYDVNRSVFLQGAVGFNYMLPAKYIRSIGKKIGVQKYGRPFNFFFTRPELSIALGFRKKLGEKTIEIKPIYSYNFTIKYLNLVPTFHSLGIETSFYF